MVFVKQRLNVPGALLFMTGWRVYFSDGNPFAQNAFVIAIDVIVCRFHIGAAVKLLYFINILPNGFDLRSR